MPSFRHRSQVSAVGVADGAPPAQPAEAHAVEKDFHKMRDSVQGPDYTPYPSLHGYICKIGMETDKLRYFQLNNHYLNYWGRKRHFEQGAHPLGSFDLAQVRHMWFDRKEYDIVFRFYDGTIKILSFDAHSIDSLKRWYQEIDKRIRHFKQLGKHANSEKSLDEMRAAALKQGLPVGPESLKHRPSEVQKVKKYAKNLGVRRATLAVPAAPLIKRFGFRKSVSSEDATPYPRVQGYLCKPGSFFMERRYYQLNNEYMNYWKTKEDWQHGRAPLGSYNVIHFAHVAQQDVTIHILFVNGHTRELVAPTAGIARQWVQFINLRRKWFVDVHSAAESRDKLEHELAGDQPADSNNISTMVSNVKRRTNQAAKAESARHAI